MESLEKRIKTRELLVFPEIRELCFEGLELCKCRNLVGDVILDNSVDIASYDSRNRLIKFNMDGLIASSNDFANNLITNSGLYPKNHNIYGNTLILVTIYHELKHVLQDHGLNIKDYDSLEYDLMILSYFLVDFLSKKDYHENYFYLPNERDAELTAWVRVLKILENLNLKPKELFELQKTFLILSVKGYEFSEEVVKRGFFPGPFERVLEKYNNRQYEIYKNEINRSLETYSTFDRIRLGLPITIDEMDKFALILKSGEPVDIEKVIVKNI